METDWSSDGYSITIRDEDRRYICISCGHFYKAERWLREHMKQCQEVICLQTPTDITEDIIQGTCVEVSQLQQELVHSSHLQYDTVQGSGLEANLTQQDLLYPSHPHYDSVQESGFEANPILQDPVHSPNPVITLSRSQV